MTEQECQQVYQELATLLQDLNLGGVVEQVEARVQAGKLEDRESLADRALQTEIGSAQAVLTKPATYTAQERLLLLIDTVERIVVDTTEIKGALVEFLTEESTRLQAPVTLSFEADRSPLLTESDAQGLEERRQAIGELRQLLQTLRQEAFPVVD
jgi:hypothetical protein